MSEDKRLLRSNEHTGYGAGVTQEPQVSVRLPDGEVEEVEKNEQQLLGDRFCGVSFHDLVYVVGTGCCGTKPKEILHSVR